MQEKVSNFEKFVNCVPFLGKEKSRFLQFVKKERTASGADIPQAGMQKRPHIRAGVQPQTVKELSYSKNYVGAIRDRPPKIEDFRISWREIIFFSPDGERILHWQNPQATAGRPYNGLF